MNKSQHINWLYVVLILFMVSLPFSEALISISGVLLLIVSFLYRKHGSFQSLINQSKELVIFSSIYFVYLIGAIFTSDTKWALYDLQKNIPYLIIPLAFIIAKPLGEKRLNNLLKIFVAAVVASAVITMINFYSQERVSVLNAQEFGFIHHIRFSFQVIFSMTIISVILTQNWSLANNRKKAIAVGLLAFLLVFLVWHQSFTGILTFIGTGLVGVGILIRRFKKRTYRIVAFGVMAILILLPLAYSFYAVNRYYDTEEIVVEQLETKTALGNPYKHDLENKSIENGHRVGLYWSEKEMKEAWNKRAELKYDEKDRHGYEVRYTLVRYLTSKNLRKDAEGVSQLTEQDIRNIENGISNYLFAQKGLSLYPRLYTTIWELDTYFKTGYANQQSVSQRIEYAKAALTIIKENFFFGVGTGNWKTAYREAYQKNESQMDPARYGDAHNQYLNYMVKFGFIGLLWILFAIAYPVVKTRSYRNPIFFLFLVSMVIANLGDSNLETHVGSSFFALFYCLFLSVEKKAPEELSQ